MKGILISIYQFVVVFIILIASFGLIIFIDDKTYSQIMLLWPGYDTTTYPFFLLGIYLLVFPTLSIVIATFITTVQFCKGKINGKKDFFWNCLEGVPTSIWLAFGMLIVHFVWLLFFGLIADIYSSNAKKYIDEQYRKYHKIPVLFTKEKNSVSIKSETKRIFNDTELEYWTCESQIENDGNIIDCYPIDPYDWDTEPVFPDNMWIDVDKPIKIYFFIQIHSGKKEIHKNNEYYVKLNYDDFKNGKTYTIESIFSDKNNHKAKFVTNYKFELELPLEIAKDYINPFKDVEFIKIK